jgi:hypothetical protein
VTWKFDTMGTRDKVADLLRGIAADESDTFNTLYRFDATRDQAGVVASILSKGTTGDAADSKMYLRVGSSVIGELTGVPVATGKAFAVSISTVKSGVNSGECGATACSVIDRVVACCARVAPTPPPPPPVRPTMRARAAVTLALKSTAERDRLISIVSFLTGHIVNNAHELVKAAPNDATVNPHNAILGCMYARYARAHRARGNEDTVVHGVIASASQVPPSFRQPFVAGFARALYPQSVCSAAVQGINTAAKATPPLTPPFVKGLGWSEGLCKAIFDGLLTKDDECRANYGAVPTSWDAFCTQDRVDTFSKKVPTSTFSGLSDLASKSAGDHVFALRRLANECEWAV